LYYISIREKGVFTINKFIPINSLFVLLTLPGLSAQELASLEYVTQADPYNSIIQVDSDTYALAYAGDDGDGYIATFTITSDGATITEVASSEHDALRGTHNSLIQVDSDTYALAYAGDGQVGFITTFTISADGATITEVASLEHDALRGTHNSLIQVDSDTYALAYAANGEDGFIKTFTITSDGATITEVASLEHDIKWGMYNSIVQVDSDTYVLAYTGKGEDGYITTFTVSAEGLPLQKLLHLCMN